MRVLTIEMLRHQCNVDWDSEDEQLLQCGEAAEAAVIGDTRRKYNELLRRGWAETHDREPGEDDVVNDSDFPARLRMAMLLIAAQLFTKREPSQQLAQNMVQYSYDYLVKPYRRLV